MFYKFLFALWIFIAAGPAMALDPGPIAQNVVAEWENWMKKHRIPEGAIAVSYDGVVVAEGGIKRTINDPAKVASLSKSITAICALKAMAATGKRYRTPLSEVIPDVLNTYPPKDQRFPEITIGQLITHTSGITSRYHRNQLEKLKSFGKENKLWQFSKLAKESLSEDPGKAEYHYTNANYLTLGLVIEALSGEDYEPYCVREVLTPAGVTTGRLNDTWTVMSAWGGWEISALDFLKFAEFYFREEFGLSRPAGVFLPAAEVGRGAKYGAGVIFRSTRTGFNTWHQGSWKWRGRIKDQYGAYFALYDNGFSVSTNYAHDAWERKIRNELDTFLWEKTHP